MSHFTGSEWLKSYLQNFTIWELLPLRYLKKKFVFFFVIFCWPWESEQWWQVWSFSLTFLFFMSLHHAVWLTCLNLVGFLIEGYFCFHFAWTFSYYSQIFVSVALCGRAIFCFCLFFVVAFFLSFFWKDCFMGCCCCPHPPPMSQLPPLLSSLDFFIPTPCSNHPTPSSNPVW